MQVPSEVREQLECEGIMPGSPTPCHSLLPGSRNTPSLPSLGGSQLLITTRGEHPLTTAGSQDRRVLR